MGHAYVAFLRRHHAAILFLAAVLLIGGAILGSQLSLRTGLEELLPTADPRVHALDEVTRRVGTMGTLVVELRADDPNAAIAYARRLEPVLDRSPLVERALHGVPDLVEFFKRNRWLYATVPQLEAIRDRLEFERDKRKNPFFVPLEEPPTVESTVKSARPPIVDRIPNGLFQAESGHLLALIVLPARDRPLDERALERAVRGAIARVRPPPGVHVKLAGDIHTAVEERKAILGDVAKTSVLVSLLVALVVAAYFGRARAVPLMLLPAILGLALALAFAELVYGQLNTSTAFLGSIIIGNGMNYPILVLARYAEERRQQRPVDQSIEAALVGTFRPTALAAFGASAAYASLLLTSFRGFSQFGAIGGVGMALCWVATVTVLPAALWALDGRGDRRGREKRRLDFGVPFAAAVRRAPRAILAVAALLTVGSAAILPRWLRDPFEYDLANLRATGAESLEDVELDQLFGRALSPSVLLADSPDQAERAAAILRARAKAGAPIEHVITVENLLPGDTAIQDEKLGILDQIRKFLNDPSLSALSPEQRDRLEKLRPPEDLRALAVTDLPEIALYPFTETDGSVGNAVLVYPPEKGFSVEDGHDLLAFSRAAGEVPVDHTLLRTAGRGMVFAAMLSAITRDGPFATLASFVVVALLVVVLLRKLRGVALVLASLLAGVLWMLGVAAAFDARINFLNFIALPITFGISVDYAGNLWQRYREGGRGSAVAAVASTGGAVALNSATTTIGYGALLIAHNRALVSFGRLAILGEIACLAAALLALPSLLSIVDRKRK